jgi:hypothetical protein
MSLVSQKALIFPVQRAAVEELHRRMQNVESDWLFVKQSPERALLGQHIIARPMNGNGSARERHAPRPYEAVLMSVAPLRGQCDCPDFLKAGLGLCKHMLTAVTLVQASLRCGSLQKFGY